MGRFFTDPRNAHLKPQRLHLEVLAPPRSSSLCITRDHFADNGLSSSRYGCHSRWDLGGLDRLVWVSAVLPCKLVVSHHSGSIASMITAAKLLHPYNASLAISSANDSPLTLRNRTSRTRHVYPKTPITYPHINVTQRMASTRPSYRQVDKGWVTRMVPRQTRYKLIRV